MVKSSLLSKERICQYLIGLIEEDISAAQHAIDLAKEARDSESKSSVGDKYETGRAMMQIEIGKHEAQLNRGTFMRHTLSQIDGKKENKKVEAGALVSTNRGIYFISVGIGKLEIDKVIVYAISLSSPIGKALMEKGVGDQFTFQGQHVEINDIQ